MRKTESGVFPISHQALEKIFRAYALPFEAHGLTLFAFRGCLPVTEVVGWRAEIDLRPAAIDYVHMRCTLGIWDHRAKKVFAAPGSTVPYKANILKAAARKGRMRGKGTNQLEPGYYLDLTKGEHLQGKLNGHQALRQTASRLYRRSLTGIPYTAQSPLYYGNPYDNLHCGWNLDGAAPKFSSAGCMVVAGLPHCRRHDAPLENQGPWKIFHDLIYAAPQRSFPILLLPAARAAEILADGKEKTVASLQPRLVFGSEGEKVKMLQRVLAEKKAYRGRITGKMDARTYRAWDKAKKGA